jgi:hypothetical protein
MFSVTASYIDDLRHHLVSPHERLLPEARGRERNREDKRTKQTKYYVLLLQLCAQIQGRRSARRGV